MGHDVATHKTSQQGFTLIEMLVAIMILSFVALGIAGLFSHAVINNASGYDYAQLATEARFAMEELQGLPFDDDDLDKTTGEPHTWESATEGFAITYTVEDYAVVGWNQLEGGAWPAATGTDVNVKRITMTVASTNQVLEGRRLFTFSAIKIKG